MQAKLYILQLQMKWKSDNKYQNLVDKFHQYTYQNNIKNIMTMADKNEKNLIKKKINKKEKINKKKYQQSIPKISKYPIKKNFCRLGTRKR